jgi:choline-sulfatase
MRVLFLDLDTLRPDHLGCYGYHRNTSPNIDSIAEEGVRFDKYYCSDAPCLPSRSALMSGQYGIHTGIVGHGGTAADPFIEGMDRNFRSSYYRTCLMSVFRKQGIRTVSVSSFSERHSAWWFNAGFNEVYNPGKGGMESAEDVTPTVLEWIKENAKEDNWLLHVNYWDPHTPYRAPREFDNPFENEPLPSWYTEDLIREHNKMVGPHKSLEISMFDNKTNPHFPRHPGEIRNIADLRKMIDGYDCGIRYMDEHIGMIFDALKKQGVFDDDLAIIITADHGENQGELGIYGEHATADNITCRIPMIVKWPGCKRGHVDSGLHLNIDLAPTIADLFDTLKEPVWDGQSYVGSLTKGEDTGREFLVLSQCAHVCQRSVRFDKWLYMRTYHDGYHLFEKEMLFCVDNDPREQHNVAHKYPEIVNKAVHYLLNWHDDMMMTSSTKVDPLWTVMKEGGPFHARGQLKRYCNYLRETGRDWATDELRRRHPGEF